MQQRSLNHNYGSQKIEHSQPGRPLGRERQGATVPAWVQSYAGISFENCFSSKELAGEPGFEPRLTESESAVLPLNYSPITRSEALGMAMQAFFGEEARGIFAPQHRERPSNRILQVIKSGRQVF